LVQNFPLPRHGADEGVVALLNRNSTLAVYISALRKGYRPDVVERGWHINCSAAYGVNNETKA
jgi:hypothetical protein